MKEIREVKWLAQHPRARRLPLLSRLDHALLLPLRQNTPKWEGVKRSQTPSPLSEDEVTANLVLDRVGVCS